MHQSAYTNGNIFRVFLEAMFPGRKLKMLDVGGLDVNARRPRESSDASRRRRGPERIVRAS